LQMNEEKLQRSSVTTSTKIYSSKVARSSVEPYSNHKTKEVWNKRTTHNHFK
jgi:hypothetical protein